MKINFRESLAATLIVSGVVFSSCVDSDKNFYDPNYRAQNPMGNISAPNGFDWLLFSSINLNVKVNDTFNGQYHYTVEVFDNNPVISPDATLLTKGFAKLGQNFTTELPVSNSIPSIMNSRLVHPSCSNAYISLKCAPFCNIFSSANI